jgi:GWxTD domain-containing protein
MLTVRSAVVISLFFLLFDLSRISGNAALGKDVPVFAIRSIHQTLKTVDELYADLRHSYTKKRFAEAIRIAREILQKDSLFQDGTGKSGWCWLGLAYEKDLQAKEALKVLEKGEALLTRNKRIDVYLKYHLARLYAELNIREKWPRITPLVYSALLHLSPKRQPDLWNLIADVLRLFNPVLTEKEKKEVPIPGGFLKTPGLAFVTLLRRFDPDPLTEINEALPVLFQRMAVAREKYPDETAPSGFDIRGHYYVRLGPPWKIYYSHSGVVGEFGYAIYPFEIWFYTRIHPALYFCFAKIRGMGSYQEIPGPESVIGLFYKGRSTFWNRSRPGETVSYLRLYLYDELAYYHEDFRRRFYLLTQQGSTAEAADYAQIHFKRMDEEHAEEARRLLDRITFDPRGVAPELSVHFDMAQFLASDGKGRIEFYFGIPRQDLVFYRRGQSESAILEIEAAILDTFYAPVVKDTLYYRVEAAPEDVEGGFIGKWEAELRPGIYHGFFRVSNPESGKRTILRNDFLLRDFTSGAFSLSDLELSTAIRGRGAYPGFEKDSVSVLPMPSKLLQRGDSLYVYFEIYRPAGAETASTRYQIDYQLEEAGKTRGILARLFTRIPLFGHKRTAVQVTDAITLRGRKAAIWKALNTSELPAGQVVLSVRVRDVRSGKEIVATKVFRLVQ